MKTIELSIKEFAVVILRKWPIALAFALVFAVLFGVLGEGSYQQQLQTKQAEYDAAAIKLSELKKERDEVKAYLEDSVLMNIDPNNKQVASMTIQITIDPVGQTANYNSSRQVQERYFALAGDAPLQTLFNDFSLKEYEKKYLNEMYSVSKGTFDLVTITAFGNQDIDAEKCVQAVYDYLLLKQEAVIEGSGLKHSISISSRGNTYVIDDSLKTQQLKRRQQLESIESEIKTMEAMILEKPVEPEATVASHNFLSQAPIGAVIGIAIGIFLISLLYVLRLSVQLPEQIQRQLGIMYLGGIKKQSTALSPGTKLAGSLRMLEEDNAIKLISANISEVLGEHRKILVTGSAPEDAIEAFIKSMEKTLNLENISFNLAKDVNADAEAVTMLSNADAVLLVERLNHSRLRKVNHTRERIEMSGKEILGYVLV